MLPETKILINKGFSERFLKTPVASSIKAKRSILNSPTLWRNCKNCDKKWVFMEEIPEAILNTDGRDLRGSNRANKHGFCSTNCGIEFYECKDAHEFYKISKAIDLASSEDFYSSDEWRKARYEVLTKYGPVCMCCGATSKDGVRIHVDHIKSRFLFPHLCLDVENLQVLCEDCNFGKGFADSTDWRETT